MDVSGRYIFLKGLVNGSPITFTLLYVPNENQIAFLSAERDVVIGGDLNFIVDLKTR